MARIEQDDFSSVSWHSDRMAAGEQSPGAASADFDPRDHSNGNQSADAGHPDAAAIGSEVLECTVSHPLKENEGAKDVFVSYLVTTYVSCAKNRRSFSRLPC